MVDPRFLKLVDAICVLLRRQEQHCFLVTVDNDIFDATLASMVQAALRRRGYHSVKCRELTVEEGHPTTLFVQL
jgi:deoxyxylulose-5-phosphate synthase